VTGQIDHLAGRGIGLLNITAKGRADGFPWAVVGECAVKRLQVDGAVFVFAVITNGADVAKPLCLERTDGGFTVFLGLGRNVYSEFFVMQRQGAREQATLCGSPVQT
jgi:hypothetical protein